MITAISLFSGAVDGLGIAAEAAGMTVTHHVEWDAWCCEVLRMNNPQSEVMNADIKTIDRLPYADVIFGGAPCQDFSLAGKRAGFAGERYLWPEMLRLIRTSQPRCVVFENVRGGVSAGLLDRVCSDLESEHYECIPLVYPANVFGAPHERYRMFVVAYTSSTGQQNPVTPQQWENTAKIKRRLDNRSERSGTVLVNAHRQRLQKHFAAARNGAARRTQRRPHSQRRNRLPQPRLGRVAYGTAAGVYRLNPARDFPGWPAGQGAFQYPYEPARTVTEKPLYASNRIKALGNAVVWQQAYPIMRAIVDWLKQEQ